MAFRGPLNIEESRCRSAGLVRGGGRRRPRRRETSVAVCLFYWRHKTVTVVAFGLQPSSSLPSSDRGGVWVGLEPTTTVRD